MTENKFILLNIEDNKSKELAQIISSETARKILSLFSDKPLSESDIAEKLKIPLSTAHYNIQQLLKAEIIEIKDFLWSEKGKKIQLYQLANKLIIISPKNSSPQFIDKIKEIIPIFLVGSFISLGIYTFQSIFSKANFTGLNEFAAPTMLKSSQVQDALITTTKSAEQNYALWFFIGIISISLIYLIFSYLRSKK